MGDLEKQFSYQAKTELNNNGQQWNFRAKNELNNTQSTTIRVALQKLRANLNPDDPRPVISLAQGDPTIFPSFKPPVEAYGAIAEALSSGSYNGYSPVGGVMPARRAIADYLSRDIPHKLSPDDVFLTVGCVQAIEIVMSVLSRPGANILLPRPGYAFHGNRAKESNLEVRYYDLLPDKDWEIDLENVEALADDNTVAMVVINPGNPCGSVYSYQHLNKVADTARKLRFLVIADEVYSHIVFGSTPFVPMGVFASIVPVLTLGSISKRWILPGCRFGWIAIVDPDGILQKTGIADCVKGCLNITADPATFIQGAVPEIIERTKDEYFSTIIKLLRKGADICYNAIEEIPCLTCPSKPQGSMFAMVKVDVSLLEGIKDNMEFCLQLAKEESVFVLPGITLGMDDWLRVSIAAEISSLEDALARIKSFYQRHAKMQQV